MRSQSCLNATKRTVKLFKSSPGNVKVGLHKNRMCPFDYTFKSKVSFCRKGNFYFLKAARVKKK